MEAASDEQLVEKVCTGELPVHSLENTLGDCEKAVRVRRGWLQRETGFTPAMLPYEGFDYQSVLGACAEMVVGYVPLPVGVAGPLLLNGKAFQVPMATVEGTLIASTRRGCKAITESGGASAVVMKHAMSRAPVLLFPSAMRAAAFKSWIEVRPSLTRVRRPQEPCAARAVASTHTHHRTVAHPGTARAPKAEPLSYATRLAGPFAPRGAQRALQRHLALRSPPIDSGHGRRQARVRALLLCDR